jgi:hypothetical protein
MPSWQNKVICKLLLVRGNKRTLSSVERTRAEVQERSLRPASYAPQERLDKTAHLTDSRRDGEARAL